MIRRQRACTVALTSVVGVSSRQPPRSMRKSSTTFHGSVGARPSLPHRIFQQSGVGRMHIDRGLLVEPRQALQRFPDHIQHQLRFRAHRLAHDQACQFQADRQHIGSESFFEAVDQLIQAVRQLPERSALASYLRLTFDFACLEALSIAFGACCRQLLGIGCRWRGGRRRLGYAACTARGRLRTRNIPQLGLAQLAHYFLRNDPIGQGLLPPCRPSPLGLLQRGGARCEESRVAPPPLRTSARDPWLRGHRAAFRQHAATCS